MAKHRLSHVAAMIALAYVAASGLSGFGLRSSGAVLSGPAFLEHQVGTNLPSATLGGLLRGASPVSGPDRRGLLSGSPRANSETVQAVRSGGKRFHSTRCSRVPAFGWLHTSGTWIEDENGCKLRLESVDWFGMETTNYVPDGLNFLPYTTILTEIKALGFNSIRLSISDQMLQFNSKLHPAAKAIRANRGLRRLHPLQILDRIVAAAHRLGLFLILDDHGSLASNPTTDHIEALWTYYGEQAWIDDWLALARRYRNDPAVIGFDIRNEPHTAGPGPWSLKTYLTQGATWGRYPSKLWNPASNWQAAATKCGDAILKVNPHLLIFVEGIQLYPDRTQPRGVETYWWGSILRGVAVDPVVLNVPHQLVYSAHEWGPRRYDLDQPDGHGSYIEEFTYRTTPASLMRIFYENWAFILHAKSPRIQAPVWLGEFGTCNLNTSCVSSARAGSQGQWFSVLIQYLKANPEIGWCFYPINGTNSVDRWSNNSILNRSWTHVKLPLLMQTLRTIMGQPRG